MSTEEYLQSLVDALPDKPGVYQYFNKEGKVIYVGKAKNLKKRVSSYFHKAPLRDNKLKVLLKRIADIQYIVVDNESDALLLENNLIKKYQPRYNVLLKDDKSFPWICIKNERFPRVFHTRNLIRDGSLYFGPYTSMFMVRTVLNLIRQMYKLRSCKYNLSEENIQSGKLKACLEYHIGNCKAPCEGLQSEEDYNESIEQIKKILRGNIGDLKHYLKDKMKTYAEAQQFEEAQDMKEKIDIIEKYQSKSTIVNPSIRHVDVYSILDDEKAAYVNVLKVNDGAIIQSHTIEMKKKLDESKEDLLPLAIVDLQQKLHSESPELIVPFDISSHFPDLKISIPKVGDKKKLLDLSERNVKYFKLEKQKRVEQSRKYTRTDSILNKTQEDLQLSEKPVHIECFDNSNIQGKHPVAACVVFKNGKPSKKDYRHFHIKTVQGPDDFASMKEVVYRRYSRLLNEEAPLPQLIIIDGGKGQMSAALESLKSLELENKISLIGIAKRLEEIYFPGDPVPLYLDKQSDTLRLIQYLRDEAHRFGIRFHRDERSRHFIKTELEQIPGIGDKTISQLMEHFKTIEQIKKSSQDQIEEVVGKHKAKILKEYFMQNNASAD